MFKKRRVEAALVAAILAAHFGVVFFSVRHKSATSDEPYHLARGASHLFSRGDFRMAVAHPPLINLITALPLLFFDDLQVPLGDPTNDLASWYDLSVDQAERKNRFAWLLLWVHDIPGWRGNKNPLAIIFWCRLPVMFLSVLLGLSLYLWTRRTLGLLPGLAALLLYSFSPSIIAHAGLITTDLGSALTIFLFALALVRLLQEPSWKWLILTGITCGLAQLSKYTAILLLPLIPLIFFLSSPGDLRRKATAFFSVRPGRPEFFTGLAGWLLLLLINALVIWAGLGFELHSIHEYEIPPPVPITEIGPFLKGHIVRAIASLHLVPQTYYSGLCRTLVDTTLHFLPLYFLGRESDYGWWYYYPLLFLMKEPLSFLVLLLLMTGFRAWRVIPGTERKAAAILAFGILAFFMFFNHKNIGIRHILPVYPFLFFGVSALFSPDLTVKRELRAGLWGLLGVYLLNAFLSFPHYLVHFNYAVGGPDGGLRQSVVGEDWGQDIWALGDFCRKNNIPLIYYNPYGNADPRAYGVPYKKFKCDRMEAGWYAVHVVDLRRPKRDIDRECATFFLDKKPVTVLHHTIYVYHFPQAPPPQLREREGEQPPRGINQREGEREEERGWPE